MPSDQRDLEWLTLDEDETLEWTGRPHRYSLVPALAIGIPMSVILVGLFVILAAYLKYINTHYVITDAGLYKKTGVLSRDVRKIGFDKVQNTSYSQSVVGADLGYGNVDVSTAGSGGVEMQFRAVPDPADVQERINRGVKTGRPGREDEDDVLEEVLEELRAIRATLETLE